MLPIFFSSLVSLRVVDVSSRVSNFRLNGMNKAAAGDLMKRLRRLINACLAPNFHDFESRIIRFCFYSVRCSQAPRRARNVFRLFHLSGLRPINQQGDCLQSESSSLQVSLIRQHFPSFLPSLRRFLGLISDR